MDIILLLDSILLVQHQQSYHSILVNTLMRILPLRDFSHTATLEKEIPCLLHHNTETSFKREPLALQGKRPQLSSETFSCTSKSSFWRRKRDDFNFHITKFPFLSSNIPSSPMAFLSHNSSDTPELARLMNV